MELVITTLEQLEELKSILHSPKCDLQRLEIHLAPEKRNFYDSLIDVCFNLGHALLNGRCGGLLDLDLSWSLLNLAVSENRIRRAIVTILAAVAGQCNIQSLNLCGNPFGDLGAKFLAMALVREKCGLHSLHLGINMITDEGAKILAEALASGKCALRSLNLYGNDITDKGTRFLADALLSGQCGLLDLSLNSNYLFKTGETVKVLAAALASSHCKIHTLNLSKTTKGNDFSDEISDEIANNLAEALLSGNCALVNLHLAGNFIGDKGIQSLANAISNTLCKLQCLDLSHNNITDKGAISLALALSSQDCRLRHLILHDNKITETGEDALVIALRANVRCQIEKLELKWRSAALKLQFDKLLKRNRVFLGEGVDVQPADSSKVKSEPSTSGPVSITEPSKSQQTTAPESIAERPASAGTAVKLERRLSFRSTAMCPAAFSASGENISRLESMIQDMQDALKMQQSDLVSKKKLVAQSQAKGTFFSAAEGKLKIIKGNIARLQALSDPNAGASAGIHSLEREKDMAEYILKSLLEMGGGPIDETMVQKVAALTAEIANTTSPSLQKPSSTYRMSPG